MDPFVNLQSSISQELVAHIILIVSLAKVPLLHVIPQLLGVMTSFVTESAILGT